MGLRLVVLRLVVLCLVVLRLVFWGAALALFALGPTRALADDPRFRFSADVLAVDAAGGGFVSHAMVGGGASIGLAVSAIEMLDVGVRARLAVAPLFTSDTVRGGPGWTGALALAARVHAPLEVGSTAWSLSLEAGPAMGQLGYRGDAGLGLVGVSAIVQPGLEHVLTPRFSLTFALDLGVLVDVRERAPSALLQGALVVGMRAG